MSRLKAVSDASDDDGLGEALKVTAGGDQDNQVKVEVGKLQVRDRARAIYDAEKAKALRAQTSEKALDGAAFLSQDVDAVPVWGDGNKVLWAKGEGLMICGPQGVGKSTLVQQLMLARMGLLAAPTLLGLPVLRDDRPVVYLAMDRPPQIRRSLNRMVDMDDELVSDKLQEQLIVWPGPPPFDASTAPQEFADWIAELGREPGLLIVDSLKDLANGLSKDEVGAGINTAMQQVLVNGTEYIDLHHQRKPTGDNRKPDKIGDVYGSTWLTSGKGSVALIWGEPGDRVVELSHLKQPMEKVGPLTIDHSHGSGVSVATDLPARIVELARIAAAEAADRGAAANGGAGAESNGNGGGITEADCVMDIFHIDKYAVVEYGICKKKVRRKLDKLLADGVLAYTEGKKGGPGGGGKAAVWRYTA